MIIGKLDTDGWKIKEVDIPEREPIFCEVCEKEVKDMNANIFQKTVLLWRELEKWEGE